MQKLHILTLLHRKKESDTVMSLNSTPSSQRLHISFFGLTNAGKSSLVNAITNQEMSVVSPTHGTTTDPVKKSMELLPLGPVVIIDTPGFNDKGELGEKRVKKTKEILLKTDIAVLVTVAGRNLTNSEEELLKIFSEKEIPFVIAKNKADLSDKEYIEKENEVMTSATKHLGIEKLKEKIGALKVRKQAENPMLSDLISPGDTVVLVIPIDASAPKGRLILPQQMAIREVLDSGGVCMMTKEDEYYNLLNSLPKNPALVICDSQVFKMVSSKTPENVRLTSFSVLMARKNGFLKTAVSGAENLSEIKDGDKILISEGCTHHRQCEDIGTVKLPGWIKEFTKKNLEFEFTSGASFPQDLSSYSLVVHCGGCMITPKEVGLRMERAKEQNVCFTNYGTLIAHMNGILERSTYFIFEKTNNKDKLLK